MRYAGVRDADPSSSVLPSSLISEPSAAQSDQKTEYLPYFHAVEALNAVSARLKAQVGCDTKGNLLLSPITTTTALAQLLLGSRGSTRSQILNILTAANRTQDFAEATVNEFHKHLVNLIRIVTTNAVFDNSYYLHLASALFYRLGSGLYPNFVNAATKLYAMDIFHLDFR
jgi:serine protease inhibitor